MMQNLVLIVEFQHISYLNQLLKHYLNLVIL
jgi:hypothetical protein